ncbi:PREDICTED: serine protease gd-like [Vollenhovia emeryi]|uniref:serine protease gd-like n=1 Tax=Vollenhovia emeryi TaxID=411798 RepID=UPI0005F4682B|nr:PREDICTED: serine protease gd-like [Vollenhovia emeryi]
MPIKISILITLLFSPMVYGDTPPCSEYFTYSVDPTTNNISGHIAISPPAVNDEFYLMVFLEANLTDGSFRLVLVRSIQDSIQAIQQGRPLLYRVNFPTEENFPIVSAIWFNNQKYCIGSEASGNRTHIIELGHIVFPPTEESNLQNFQPWHRNSSSYSTYYKTSSDFYNHQPTTAAPSDKTVHNEERISSNSTINNECGVTSYYTDSTNKLLPDCDSTLPGQWPWVVAIYVLKSEQTSEFRCSGSVLTTKHIITVEPCLKLRRYGPNTVQVLNDMYAAFGQYNLRQWHETGTLNRKIKDYTYTSIFRGIPSTYRDKYYLGILTVETPVEYSPFIKPICLWDRADDFEDISFRTGYVVGFDTNVSENQTTRLEELRMARVMILDKEYCSADNQTDTSIDKFCVQLQNVGQSCYADSGSGLVLNVGGRYLLRGVVLRQMTSTSVYVTVDIAKHLHWILDTIQREPVRY